MHFSSLSIAALAISRMTDGFTPLVSSRQWGRGSSTLFDIEQVSPWSVNEWNSGDLPHTLSNGMDSNAIAARNSNFMPSEDDLVAAEKALAAASVTGGSNSLTKVGNIENEFPNKRKLQAKVRETGRDSMKNYIKTMCDHELLNKNEEIILAREIQILLKWEEQREELETQLLR